VKGPDKIIKTEPMTGMSAQYPGKEASLLISKKPDTSIRKPRNEAPLLKIVFF